ncbi:MAG TPA: Gfo/Idh/MocA family oxidoreductase [Gemmataceae bacterium]|nr:Gfo/Idh/MocA family oxidoreductase [Gemmataceae bacterium]
MDKLRWGILGVAKINARLLPAFAAAADTVVLGIASRDVERAKAAAQSAGIPKVYGGYDALLADPEIQAVYIPLPNGLHAEWTKKTADAGKHVLCEKPLAPTAAEAAEMVAHCRTRGVRLMDGFMWPHNARTARLRRVLDAGEIGALRRVGGTFTFTLPSAAPNVRFRPDLGGGSLLDVGCYPVYGIRWAFQAEPVRVTATAKMRGGVDVEMSGVLEFANGRMGTFDCGFNAPLRQWLEITGTSGVIRVHEMWVPNGVADFVIDRDGQKLETAAVDGPNQIVAMLEEFGRAVREGRDPVPGPDEAVKTLRVLDALARSAREGRAVEV